MDGGAGEANQVERAIVNLERRHFIVFNPVIAVKRVIRNRVMRLPEPVFPSYVFIELADGQLWIPINSTFGFCQRSRRWIVVSVAGS